MSPSEGPAAPDPGAAMRALTSVMRPSTVAVIGASTQRHTLGNQVLQNFTQQKYRGSVLAVHPRAASVEGRQAVASIDLLPPGIDVAMVCLPAQSVLDVLGQLDRKKCRAAVVPTAGFTAAQYQALADGCRQLDLLVTGPNCLGILSVADATPLWTASYRSSFPAGSVGLVAQSGSAAISVMSSHGLEFSRIISSGSELEVTSAEYVRWLAQDEATSCIGLIIESIRSPREFAAAISAAHSASKPVVALKVGRSALGSQAAQAHTGALVTDYDAYKAFFRRIGIATVLDYDELVGTLQCMSNRRMPRPGGSQIGIVGISGGQTALACDIAEEVGAQLATFADETVRKVEDALPGGRGLNPVDIGSSIRSELRRPDEVLSAVLADPNVDSVLVIQDAQSTLPLTPAHVYITSVSYVEQASREATKPIVLTSSSAGDTHPMIEDVVAGSPVPLLRGLRPAIVALRNLTDVPAQEHPVPLSGNAHAAELAPLVAQHTGPLPHRLAVRLLLAYGIPLIRSELAADREEAEQVASAIGYPLVVKVASPDIPHRLEVGGVVVDIRSPGALAEALSSIDMRVRRAVPDARIEGYELQEYVAGAIEAVIGFTAAPPFGAMMVVGSGGSLVELLRDRSVDLAPVTAASAARMIGETKLGRVLGGYRNLAPVTPVDGLAAVVQRLSLLAADLGGLIAEADLNPALIAPGSGDVKVVDALLVGRSAGQEL